jgi:DNA (cytosine-5)-methyltransferase 1
MFLESNAAERNSMSLASAVHYVPTPTARDWKGSTITKNHPRGFNAGLADYVKLWPTPQASDNRDRGNLSNRSIQRRALIGKQLMLSQVVSDKSGQLNPPWVEWLMGFPIGWTDCTASETQSSPKSPS